MKSIFKYGKGLVVLILSVILIFGAGVDSFAYTPGKVTNVGFNSYDTVGVKDDNRLSWNTVQGAEGYQIRMVDPQGTEYGKPYLSVGGVYKEGFYVYSASTTYKDITPADFMKIKSVSGGYDLALDSDGNTLCISPGVTYKVYVRAVRGTGDESTYGPWSDPAIYSFAKVELVKPTNLRIVETLDNYRVYYDPSRSKASFQVEIKDSAGNLYYTGARVVTPSGKPSYEEYDYFTATGGYFTINSNNSLYTYERSGNSLVRKTDDNGNYIKPFVAGKNYSIRIRSYTVESNGQKSYSAWSDPLTVNLPKNSAPEAPGCLIFDKSDNSFKFAKVNNATAYHIEIKDSKNNLYSDTTGDLIENSGNRYYYLNSYYQIKKNDSGNYEAVLDSDGKKIYAVKPGETYTIRVRAYNISNVLSTETNTYEKQYSAWSEPLKCVISGEEYADVTKVTGLRAYSPSSSSCYLVWDKAEGDLTKVNYEVEIKDSKGRYYKYLDESSGTQVLKDYSTTDNDVYRSDIEKYYTYINVDGKYEAVIDYRNNKLVPFSAGETYTTRVRMIADVMKKDGSGRETKTGPWSDAYTFVVAGNEIESGYDSTPGKVTGLWVEDEPKDGAKLTNPIIRWNKFDEVTAYLIEVSDLQGHIFTSSAYFDNGKLELSYYTNFSNSVSLSAFSSCSAYIANGSSNATVLRDSDNAIVRPFAPGQTYKIRVRAYNSYQKKNADGSWTNIVYHLGEWSDPCTYTVKSFDYKVTNVSFIRREEDYYLFDYTADTTSSTVYYQIAAKSDFSAASIVKDWYSISTVSVNSTTYKLGVKYTYLEPNTQYYLRIVNSKYGSPGSITNKKEYNSLISTAGVAAFKTDSYEGDKQPKDITGLKKYDEDSTYYYFRFDSILEYSQSDKFEVQINTTADQNSNNWSKYNNYSSSSTKSFSIPRSAFVNGDNYVRVVAYITKDKKNIYGKPSNVVKVTVERETTSSIGVLSLLEETDSSYVFAYTGNPRFNESIDYVYADTSNFVSNSKHDTEYTTSTFSADDSKRFSISKLYMKPGKTYYIKARVYNANANSTNGKYSSYSNVVKINTTAPKASVADLVTTKNSVTIHMAAEYNTNWVRGYEFQRKYGSGKKAKWKTINKSSISIFTNKKLKAFKTYSYRIRPYYYDKDIHKYTYGEWVYTEAMPGWSGSIILHATPASKTSIKLTWNKVKGAKGYEIYRNTKQSVTSEIKNGYNNSYTNYKLIKTLKAGKKSYVDKNLTPEMSYTYTIRAYKMVGKKKVYIQNTDTARLDFYMTSTVSYMLSDGRYKYEWKPVISAKGYKIEKKDPLTETWTLYKTIKNYKTKSFIFPASKDYQYGDTYRIYAFNGKEITNELEFNVSPFLAAPANVKAKVSGNKVTISWNPVKGADYYRVYRTTEPPKSYDKDSKGYTEQSGTEVGRYIADKAADWGYRERKLEEMNVTSVVDEAIYVTKNGITNRYVKGPDTGVKYYYFVKAYKVKTESIFKSKYSSASYYNSLASKFVSAQINEAKPPKAVISKLTSKKKSVTITIKGNDKADGYEIERSLKKKKGFKLIGEAEGVTVTYTDKYNKKKNKLKKGKIYYYRVRSFTYNDNGTKVYSAYSSVKKVKVK